MDENGPYGVAGKTAYLSGDTDKRVNQFCAKATGVKEAQFFTEIDDVTDDNREAMQVYVKMMDDESERAHLFNSDFTHVGISCGCDSRHEERCCFAYGKDVQNKPGVQTWDMLMKQTYNCKQGDNYDDQVIIVQPY